MKRVQFKESISTRLYDNYLNRVERMLFVLNNEDRAEATLEINSHIYERMQAEQGENETELLLNVLDNLGDPEIYLKSLVADRKVAEATRSFKPKVVFQALRLNLKNGLIFNLFAFLYLLIASFVFLIGAKLMAPEKTGLFYRDGVFESFGLRSDVQGLTEVMGYWFIPVIACAAIAFYLFLTLLLRFTRKR